MLYQFDVYLDPFKLLSHNYHCFVELGTYVELYLLFCGIYEIQVSCHLYSVINGVFKTCFVVLLLFFVSALMVV